MTQTVDLSDPDTYAHGIPHDVFRRLRVDDPVSWQAEPGGRGFWAITRHLDAMAVLRDPRRFSSWKGGALLGDPPPEFLAKLREGMLHRDPPDHTRLRKLVNRAFDPRRVSQLEEHVASRARLLIAGLRGRSTCDFAREIAGEMPLFVICEVLGVPVEDRATLIALTERMLGTNVEDRAAALRDGIAAAEQMRSYAASLAHDRRQQPTDDLVSELLAAEIDGHKLSDGEFQAFFMLLFNAGSDTTKSLLCFGLDLLIDHPDAMTRLRGQPDMIPDAVEEMLRYEPPVIQFRRTATEHTTLGSKQIAEGDKVVVFFPSANRDEAVFPSPDSFDIDRRPSQHLAFGYGPHNCLGAPLARLEARYVLSELLAATREIERRSPLVLARSNFIRGVRQQEIAFE